MPSTPRVSRPLAAPWRPLSKLPPDAFASDGVVLGALVALTLLLGWAVHADVDVLPASVVVVPLLVGALLLRLRSMWLLVAVAATVLVVLTLRLGLTAITPGTYVVVGVTAAITLGTARARARLGVQGLRGESTLVDLRDRLRAQGEFPVLPGGWQAEVALRSAGGSSFGGDFLVAARAPDGKSLEVALVDVSGKGFEAGTRSLLLSGAFGGLLGAMPSEQFLPAANEYLLRQEWEEGFATAAHVALDLETGEYAIASAGHPPVAHFVASRGAWHITGAQGVLLGVLPGARYVAERGRLDRGDALLLYTDGLIEAPGRDLGEGIDRLVGEAERLVTGGFRYGARRLVDVVGAGQNDDRAIVLVWRE
jgi:hypothetical protein